jgi:hypothetical protein
MRGTRGKLVFVNAKKAYSRSRGTVPLILNLATRWRWVVNFTSLPLCPRERSPVPSEQKPEWPVWMFRRRKVSSS